MFGHLGCDVTKLVRRRFAFLTDSDLACGSWRHLTDEEIMRLKETVHMQ